MALRTLSSPVARHGSLARTTTAGWMSSVTPTTCRHDFSVLTHAIIDLQVIAESDEEGAESAKVMLADFHEYFGEAVDGLDNT